MSDQPKYSINYSGTFTESQFAAGDHAVLTMHAGTAATSRLTDEQLEQLRYAIAQLEKDVRARAPEDRRDEALAQLTELAAATIGADEPDISRLKRIGGWFAQNVPELAGSVTTLLLGPAVGALVGGAGKLAAALFDQDAG
jgi:hypothetical protein